MNFLFSAPGPAVMKSASLNSQWEHVDAHTQHNIPRARARTHTLISHGSHYEPCANTTSSPPPRLGWKEDYKLAAACSWWAGSCSSDRCWSPPRFGVDWEFQSQESSKPFGWGLFKRAAASYEVGRQREAAGDLQRTGPLFSVRHVAAGTSVEFTVWRIYASGKSKLCSRKAAEQVEFHWHAAVRLSGTNKPLSVIKDTRPVTEIQILNHEKRRITAFHTLDFSGRKWCFILKLKFETQLFNSKTLSIWSESDKHTGTKNKGDFSSQKCVTEAFSVLLTASNGDATVSLCRM